MVVWRAVGRDLEEVPAVAGGRRLKMKGKSEGVLGDCGRGNGDGGSPKLRGKRRREVRGVRPSAGIAGRREERREGDKWGISGGCRRRGGRERVGAVAAIEGEGEMDESLGFWG
ncbi:hypothetical protein HAX54_022197 [Datura stramonium]|uniref:Uncharacterized protein n=1 Tax=Datura stramonium TaxID=4076 RepID=A0ABS8S679_DATST|nr:hypothetical protein [Datura stramonium]